MGDVLYIRIDYILSSVNTYLFSCSPTALQIRRYSIELAAKT